MWNLTCAPAAPSSAGRLRLGQRVWASARVGIAGVWLLPPEPIVLILPEPLQILTGGCRYSSLTVGVLYPQNRREVLGGVGELTLSSRRTLVKGPQSSAWENLCFYLEPSHL